MRKSTRVLAILLAMMMILSSVPVAFADEDKTAYPDAPYWGDLNGDQKVNFSDIARLNNIRLGKIEGTLEQRCFGDVNLDGELSGLYNESVGLQEDREDNMFKDILQINKYRLGKISSLPAESLAKITFNEPTKLSYKKGESFNKSGMSVVVQNKNNSSVKYTFTDNYITVTGFDSSTTGTKRLTATFRGLTWSFNVTVSPITHTVTYNYSYNGGTSASITSATVAEGAAIDLSPTAIKSGWTFVGWNTNANATTKLSSLNMGTSNVTLYAIFKKTLTGTFIDYSGTAQKTTTKTTTIWNRDTSGTVTAPTQNTYTGWTKRGWTTSTTADATPNTNTTFTISSDTTYYGLYQRTLTLSYNANGGNSTPSSQTGTQYANSYSISSTKNPTLKLANAISKSGFTFDGWAMGSASGTKYAAGANITISKDTTMYATWKAVPVNIYNLGEETYSFGNFRGKYIDQYGQVHASQCYDPNCNKSGHCFGMSITSAGYYLGELNKSLIGSSNDKSLFSFSFTDAVKEPIHYYQVRQDENRDKSMIAGGTAYKTWRVNPLTGKNEHKNDITKDWNEVVNRVKDHSFDNKGNLQIGFRKDNEGGHAINFLRYEVVDGEERIYAYDNNYPIDEVYFSKDSNGKVFEHGYSTFSGAIDCITLRDVKKYFDLEGSSNESTVSFIVPIDNVVIDGAKAYPLDDDSDAYILLEAKNTDNHFIVRPLVDYASFSCSGRECQFGAIDDDTYADIVFPDSPSEGSASGAFTFTIHNAPNSSSQPSNPSTPTQPQPSGGCAYCGGTHTGIFGWLIGFIHSILAMFGLHK